MRIVSMLTYGYQTPSGSRPQSLRVFLSVSLSVTTSLAIQESLSLSLFLSLSSLTLLLSLYLSLSARVSSQRHSSALENGVPEIGEAPFQLHCNPGKAGHRRLGHPEPA